MTQPGMLFVDAQRCIGCERCEIYCAVAHSQSRDLEKAIHESPPPESRVQVRELGEFSAPYQCRHCEAPPCVESCPTTSLSKGDDVRVLLNLETCTGQAKCTKRCPFLGIWMGRDGAKAVKCDLCIGRLQEGLIPACAEACPTDAITYKAYDDLSEAELKLRSGSPGAALVRRAGIGYVIDPELCIGCMLCAKVCPAGAASGEKKQPHTVDQEKCVTCGGCFLKCPKDAILAVAPDKLEVVAAEMAAKAPAPEAPAEPPPAEEQAPAEEPPAEEPAPQEAPAAAPASPAPACEPGSSGPRPKELRRRERKARRKARKAKGKKD